MGFNDWIYLVLEPHPLTHRQGEVEQAIRGDLARALETRLRGRVDQGIDLRSAERAQAVRVRSEGNRLVIDEGADHGVVRARAPHAQENRTQLDDLYHTSLAPPEVIEDGRVVFRTIAEEDLFGAHAWQDEIVDRTAQDVVMTELVDAFDRASKKVALEHPGDRLR